MFSFIMKIMAVTGLLLMVNSVVSMTDPMQPPTFHAVKLGSGDSGQAPWNLTSTLISQKRRLATINGKTLSVGDKVNGAKLIDIQPAAVTITYQNRSIVLKLLPLTVKRQRRSSME